MLIVLSMALLCNIPYFFVRNLSPLHYNKVYFYYVDTNLGKSDVFKLVYYNILYPAYTVCLPVIIVLIVIVKTIVVLRKNRNVQDSSKLQNNIDTILITVLLAFIISQFLLLVASILRIICSDRSSSYECDRVAFYFSGIVFVLVALNSAVKPFIYMVLKNHFAWHTPSLRIEGVETIEVSRI